MTRFISKTEQINTHKESSSFLHYLLLVIIVMEFIRLPNVPSTDFRPLYLVVFFCIPIILIDLKYSYSISSIIIKMSLLLLFLDIYTYLLAWGLNILNEKQIDMYTVVPSVKKFIEFFIFATACSNLIELKRIIFTITITIFISAVFGLLIYHFGEPFQSIRDWLWQSKTEFLTAHTKGLGKGDFVTGLSGKHWLFGYLMTAGPALALICGRLSPFKWWWAIVFLLMCYALYLNAQRGALLFSGLAVVSLLAYWRLISLPSICIGLAVILCIYIVRPGSNSMNEHYSVNEERNLMDRLEHGKEDSEGRLQLWKAGILSVIKSPWIGPVRQEYTSELFGYHQVIVLNNPDRKRPFVHNSYINPGMHIGFMGWFIVLSYLIMLKKVLTKVFTEPTENKEEKIIFEGISITLLAPMLYAIFQNDSIFSGEPTNLCLTGLLFSCYQMIDNKNTVKYSRYKSKNSYA